MSTVSYERQKGTVKEMQLKNKMELNQSEGGRKRQEEMRKAVTVRRGNTRRVEGTGRETHKKRRRKNRLTEGVVVRKITSSTKFWLQQ